LFGLAVVYVPLGAQVDLPIVVRQVVKPSGDRLLRFNDLTFELFAGLLLTGRDVELDHQLVNFLLLFEFWHPGTQHDQKKIDELVCVLAKALVRLATVLDELAHVGGLRAAYFGVGVGLGSLRLLSILGVWSDVVGSGFAAL